MTRKPIELLGLSHICIAVSDMEVSLAFYRDLLGLEVFFDLQLEVPAMETVTGETGPVMQGGAVVELLDFAHRDLQPQRRDAKLGCPNVSLSVRDIDATAAAITAAGIQPEQQPVDIGGVRMFFVRDPDGTPVEFVSFPNGERNSAQMWGYTGQ